MTRATDELMDSLHGLVAESFIKQLKEATDAGEGVPPALMASAARFLKDNGIDRPGSDAEAVDKLEGLLPNLSEVLNFPGSK